MRKSGTFINRVTVAAAGLLAAALVTGLAILEGTSETEPRHPPRMIAPWVDHIVTLDEALAARDLRSARWAYEEAYNAARASQRWEAMADLGAAAIRLGDVRRARTAYLTAAFRARASRAPDGLLRVVEGFLALGDVHLAERWLGIAEKLAQGEPNSLARVRAAIARFAERSAPAASP